MTDSEKELRRRAQAIRDALRDDDNDRLEERTEMLHEFHNRITAATVLALLERIEALEKQVGEAERKGAEEMRECASNEAATVVGATFGVVERIRDLPLPGDAP